MLTLLLNLLLILVFPFVVIGIAVTTVMGIMSLHRRLQERDRRISHLTPEGPHDVSGRKP